MLKSVLGDETRAMTEKACVAWRFFKHYRFPQKRLKWWWYRLCIAFQGKQTNRVACGSAHTIAWSTTKPANAGRLPREVPMEFNHLQHIPLGSLRNRLMLLHHFSDLVCSSIALFDLQPRVKDHLGQGPLVALDPLRGVLIPSGKVSYGHLSCLRSIYKPSIRNIQCRLVKNNRVNRQWHDRIDWSLKVHMYSSAGGYQCAFLGTRLWKRKKRKTKTNDIWKQVANKAYSIHMGNFKFKLAKHRINLLSLT